MFRRFAFGFGLFAVCALASAQQKVVLGQLGQTTEPTNIQAAPNGKARTYYRLKAFEYVVLKTADNETWKKVLLRNGSYGYVRTTTVAELPYEVTQPVAKRDGGSAASRSSVGRDAGSSITNYAMNFIGTPYVWGGDDERKGIDCSGFVKKMFGSFGASLPRTAAEQALVGTPIKRLEDLRAGDRLYFWSSSRNKIGHTGIYMGNGYFVHSSSGKGGVSTDYLGKPDWMKILVAARR